ncbi:MAG: FecR domain-containing protein [Hyphomicrobiaceae bacterium]
MTHDGPRPGHPPRALSDEALEWIVRLHSGEARKQDRAAFAAWRAQSAEHEAAAAEAESLWSDASDLHWDPEAGLIRPGRRTKPGISRRAVLGGIAGVGAGTAGALWASGALRPLMADYSTAVGEIRAFDLLDGTRVTLNAMSALNLDFSPAVRRVLLDEGQAYFEVAPNATRPFEVKARGTMVSALGTAFDVDCNLADGRVSVCATEHSVRVQSTAGSPSNGIVLSQGHKVVVTRSGRLGPVVEQDSNAALAWKTGMLIAEGMELQDVIAALRAHHKGWIVIQDASVKTLRVNAVLDLRTPNESIDALAAGLPIRIRRLSNYFTVISEA